VQIKAALQGIEGASALTARDGPLMVSVTMETRPCWWVHIVCLVAILGFPIDIFGSTAPGLSS